MKKKKVIITTIIVVAVLLAAGLIIGWLVYRNRFIYNEEGALGNTTGNLYNDGMFCVYDGYVYFFNPDDDGRIYRMKEDGSQLKKIHNDRGTHLNICNDYIYYVKDNMGGKVTFISIDMLNGISRLKIGDNNAAVIHSGVSDTLMLCGNELFFRTYNEKKGSYSTRKATIDGKEDTALFEDGFLMLDYDDGKIYYANTVDNHNLMRYEVKKEKASECYAGNFYMPDKEGNYLYYIDLENEHRISRIDLSTMESEALSDDYAINYNVNSKTKEIYYQVENDKEDHRLCKMKLDGSEQETVLKGDYADINFTEEYVYFYLMEGRNDYTLYRSKLPDGVPEAFHPGKID